MKSWNVTLLLCSALLLGVVANYLLTTSEGVETADGSSLLDTQPIDVTLAPPTPSLARTTPNEDGDLREEDGPLDPNWSPAKPPASSELTADFAQQEADLGAGANRFQDTASAAAPVEALSTGFQIPHTVTALADDQETTNDLDVQDVGPAPAAQFETPDGVTAWRSDDLASDDIGVDDKPQVAPEPTAAPELASVLIRDDETSSDVEDTPRETFEPIEVPIIAGLLTGEETNGDIAVDNDNAVENTVPETSDEPETPITAIVDVQETPGDADLEADQTSAEESVVANPAAGSTEPEETNEGFDRDDVDLQTVVAEPAPPTGRASQAADQAADHVVIEVFRERYPNGNLKVEREVALDDNFNYVNHGMYRHWSEAGALIAEGRLNFGRRTGVWKRAYARNESDLFAHEPFKSFREPFISTATFREGRLHGKWTIQDSEDRIASEIEFVDGARDGRLLHYYPNGSRMREIDFRNGVVDGFLRDFDKDGAVLREHKYLNGHYLSTRVESYVSTTKKSETNLMHPRMTIKSADDWWNAKMAQYGMEEGEPLRHGLETVWYETGQLRFRGEFDRGQAIGEFVWWQENGQLSRKGEYVDAKQHGEWSWWHKDGSRSVLGNYDHGTPVGRWLFWKPGGKLDQLKDLSGGSQPVAEEQRVEEERIDERSVPEPALPNDARSA